MITFIPRQILCHLIFVWANVLAFAEDAKVIPYFSEAKSPSLITRERELDSIMAKCPKAVKLFEFHDDVRTIILLKVSDHSYGTITWGGSGGAEFVFDPEPLKLISRNKVNNIAGEFTYQSSNPENGIVTYAWSLEEKVLDLKGERKLLFLFQFPPDNKSAAVGKAATIPVITENTVFGKKVTIAVDWEFGRIEGVKVTPITGKEKRLEP